MSNTPEAEAFFLRHAERVYNLALRLTGNPSDAEDLAQDALLRALRALPGFRAEAEASTWVFRITVNAWKNRVRAEKSRKIWQLLPLDKFFGKDEDDHEEAFKSDDPPLDSDLEKTETGERVQKALLSLDEESRAVVVLREIEGFSYEQIAHSLGVPEGTVKSRLSRARESLRERLKEGAPADG